MYLKTINSREGALSHRKFTKIISQIQNDISISKYCLILQGFKTKKFFVGLVYLLPPPSRGRLPIKGWEAVWDLSVRAE